MSVTRVKAASSHLALSVLVGAASAAAIFGLWYPGPHRHLAGGQNLFWLIVAVDVVLGPLLTLVVYNPEKSRSELIRDMAVITALQLSALCFGVWTLHQARPVHLVFEVDRFRVVSAADVNRNDLGKAPVDLRRLPLTGPTVIAARLSRNNDELLASVAAAAAGVEISMQPDRWVPYDEAHRRNALARARPWATVDAMDREGAHRDAVLKAASDAGLRLDDIRLLPVQSRFATWSAVLDPKGEPIALVPIDIF